MRGGFEGVHRGNSGTNLPIFPPSPPNPPLIPPMKYNQIFHFLTFDSYHFSYKHHHLYL